jgi:DNA polymerase-3 subunit beta
MKLSLTQENLSKALGSVGRIVSTRATLPVLSNVLLSTDGSRLRLSATNLEIGINYWIGSSIEKEGSVTVPARLLADFVASLPSGNIKLESNGATLSIKAPNYESKINGIPADDFPTIPEIDNKPVLVVNSVQLKEALAQVVIAASVDEARPVLAGVLLYTDDEHLYVVATDSYRLAEKKLPLPDNTGEFKVIIPVRTMQELLKLISDVNEDVELYVDESQAMFRLGDVEIISRIVEGQFPPYQQIIPTEAKTSFDINTAEFSRLVKVASLFARESAGSIRMEIREEGEVALVSSDSEIGGNKSSANCEVSGADGEISLNARYMQDALSVIKSKEVRFSMNDKLSACVLAPVDDDSYLHIVMPLRT